ncbi:MAG TPA: hypothetical protein DDW49_02870 [Deltaproteobacteria bacterium]|nr:MAG: hypothetical protein A2048_02415 [Deltaproteobacteria bacterium GWA2_45_12]HBF12322.1 hypothetical protein [Deltaproteobacteria bacterium]
MNPAFLLHAVCVLVLSLGFSALKVTPAQANAVSINDIIATSIKGALSIAPKKQGEWKAYSALKPLYANNGYKPLWSNEGKVKSQARQLIVALESASEEGLIPENYPTGPLSQKIAEVRGKKLTTQNLISLARFDLLFSNAFLIYASHLAYGFVNQESFKPVWFNSEGQGPLIQTLYKAVNNKNLKNVLYSLLPRETGYSQLKEAVKKYKEIVANGGWKSIPLGPKIEPLGHSPRIPLVRERLSIEDYFPKSQKDKHFYDEKLVEAVKTYQHNNGLFEDGVIGDQTISSFNVSAQTRLNQIVSNLDRMRAFPNDPGPSYIYVNIPAFYLNLVEKGNVVLTMKTITGRKERPSPLLSHKITYMVISPKWHVPTSIAVKDKLPLLQKDPNFLANNDMKLYSSEGKSLKEIDPSTVNWAEITPENFSYSIIQQPGEGNALGSIKFMFPNKHNVYLHDTSQPELFARQFRNFSSGCIRIEKPMELADYVLRGNKEWTSEKINAAITNKEEQYVPLKNPLAIHLVYRTAWIDEQEVLQLRNDVYEADKEMMAFLHIP